MRLARVLSGPKKMETRTHYNHQTVFTSGATAKPYLKFEVKTAVWYVTVQSV
jgi:hypothetical protein